MFDYDLLLSEFEDKIGVRESLKPGLFPLSTSLTSAENLIDSVNQRFLKVETLDKWLELFEEYLPDEWDIGTPYAQGELVKALNGDQFVVYQAVIANTGNDPIADDGTNWESALSVRLRQIRTESIKDFFNELGASSALFNDNDRVKKSTKVFRASSRRDLQTKQGKFRALRINPYDQPGFTQVFQKFGAYLTAAQTLPVYLYHSDNDTFLQQFDLVYTASDINKYTEKELIDTNGNELKITSYSDQQYGGIYEIGFYEDDLVGDLYTWDYTWDYYRCPGCYNDRVSKNYWNIYSPYIGFMPVEYSSDKLDKPNTPDMGEYFDQYGRDGELAFNLTFSFYDDPTNVILDNGRFFNIGLKLKYAIDVLTFMKDSKRINDEADMKAGIKEVLYGSEETQFNQPNENQDYKVIPSRGLIPFYEKVVKPELVRIFGKFNGEHRGLRSIA